MVKVMAPELAASNIRINGIAPGIIRTKFARAVSMNQLYERPRLNSHEIFPYILHSLAHRHTVGNA